MIQIDELNIELTDEEWPLEWIDHDRVIARAIVVDDEGYYYFVRAERDDDFGKATLIETSGGGVEPGEELTEAGAARRARRRGGDPLQARSRQRLLQPDPPPQYQPLFSVQNARTRGEASHPGRGGVLPSFNPAPAL